jgi:hypothetical protein
VGFDQERLCPSEHLKRDRDIRIGEKCHIDSVTGASLFGLREI